MNILAAEQLVKFYGDRPLFNDISFGIEEGEKIGLVGVNGTGKSTFLKVIAGLEQADAGTITCSANIKVEYLPQMPDFDAQGTVLDQVFAGGSPAMQALRNYERTLAAAQRCPADAALQAELIELSQQLDALQAWPLLTAAKVILTRLGITDFSQTLGGMSGGQRKRVALAGALIQPADLLILDEPTNHIDNDMVAWLEQYLQEYKGALLMVTHDRYFLERVTRRIFELDNGKLYCYDGNYSGFLAIKAEREEQLAANERKRQSLLRKELAWIQRGARARSTKQKARLERFETLNSQAGVQGTAKLEIDTAASRLGRKIISLEGIGKSIGGRSLFRDFSYTVLRDDRIGIIGPNGCGKSTLLNVIAGQLLPDEGMVEIGQTVKIGYFSQLNGEMDERLRVNEYITEGGTVAAGKLLERFLFSPRLQHLPISKLSGGEKRRLYLLKILTEAPNILLLDEPTNDLDIQTLSVLEDYLDNFAGAVIIVSHDRYFLDRLVEKTFSFEPEGRIRQTVGGYSDWLESKAALVIEKEPTAKQEIKREDAKRPRRFSYNEQREYEQIDDHIAETEAELRSIHGRIAAAGSDFVLLQELTAQQQQIEQRMDELLERWTYLNELAEEMERG